MTENQEHKESIKDIFPSGKQLKKIVALSIAFTFVGIIIFSFIEGYIIGPVVRSKNTERSVSNETHQIISNIKIIRAVLTASMYWYADYADGIEIKTKKQDNGTIDNLAVRTDKTKKDTQYQHKMKRIKFSHDIHLAQDAKYAKPGDYIIEILNDGKTLCAGYKLGKSYNDEAVRKRLTLSARSEGLLGKDGKNTYHKDDEVYIAVMNIQEE